MRIFHAVGCAAAISATAAQAQLSTTNCIAGAYGSLNCQTTGLSPQSSSGGTDLGAAGLGLFIARHREKAFQAHVGKLVAAGDCQGAITYALQKGRMDMAQQVRDFCAGR
jgi:hypothetical protein